MLSAEASIQSETLSFSHKCKTFLNKNSGFSHYLIFCFSILFPGLSETSLYNPSLFRCHDT